MRETGHIHAGRLATSPRLQRVLEVLRGRGLHGATTMELIQIAKVCAVNSIVSELRQNGLEIICKDEGLNEDGARVFRYTLVESRQGQGLLF